MAGEFKVHLLNARGLEKAAKLEAVFDACLKEIDNVIGSVGERSARERALVVTKLQEASFFAKRAIAQLPENQIAKEST